MSYQTQLIKDIFDGASGKHEHAGVQVYHNNFIENGIRALSISFPTLSYFINQADFRALARAYLLAHPKTEFDWADYGHTLPEFLMSHPNFVELPYLAEVAELDWLLQQVERSEDKTFDAESFGLIEKKPLEQLRFVTAPGFTIAKFFFPVAQLFTLANDTELAIEGPKRQAFMQSLNKLMGDAINMDAPRSIVLWRGDYKAQMHSLETCEHTLFASLKNKLSIDDVFSHFADEPNQISIWLSEQIVQKRIFGVQSSD